MLKKDQNSEKNYNWNILVIRHLQSTVSPKFPCNSLGEVAFTQNKKRHKKRMTALKHYTPCKFVTSLCYMHDKD